METTPITKHPKIVENARWYHEDKTAYLEGVSEAAAILQPKIDALVMQLKEAVNMLLSEGYAPKVLEDMTAALELAEGLPTT